MGELKLDAYLKRIGHEGDLSPNVANLHALVSRHVQSIPFENLDVLAGRGISLAPEAVEAKLVAAGRGGYCFEHNSLFARVLEALGYRVQLLSARVRLNRPADFIPPRTHVFCLVACEGEQWLADVGVGGLSPTFALRLAPGRQEGSHEARQLVWEGAWGEGGLRGPEARILHQAWLGESWADVCEFTLEASHPIDREVANCFTSTHPDSHFRDRLMVALATPEGRITLQNRSLTLRRGAHSESHSVDSPEALRELLHTHFGIAWPAEAPLDFPCLAWAS